MGYVPQPSSLLLFILETGSYNVAHAGLEPCLLLLSLLDFEPTTPGAARRTLFFPSCYRWELKKQRASHLSQDTKE